MGSMRCTEDVQRKLNRLDECMRFSAIELAKVSDMPIRRNEQMPAVVGIAVHDYKAQCIAMNDQAVSITVG